MGPRPLLLLLCALLLVACGGGGGDEQTTTERTTPVVGGGGGDEEGSGDAAGGSGSELGFPGFATKNTTRVGGADAVATAAGVARAVFPARSKETRPAAVTLVDGKDWRAAISAAQLMSRPLRAPVLLSDGGDMR